MKSKRYYVSMWTKRGYFGRFATNSLRLAKSPSMFKFVHIIKVTDRETYDVVFYKNRGEL